MTHNQSSCHNARIRRACTPRSFAYTRPCARTRVCVVCVCGVYVCVYVRVRVYIFISVLIT